MQCGQCSAENPDGNRYCDSCGAALGRICAACHHPNRVDAKFCGECGKPLVGAEPQAGARPLSAADYTPAHLATRILNSRLALEGERKQVTVLFADIRGSMELIHELDPEEALQRLDPALKAMMDAVHRYEGMVNRVQGDGIMALFGAPIAHEDHAVRACLAAQAMLDAVAKLDGSPVRIRIGMNSGEVVVRSIGNDLSIDYDAVGQTVHLAHRIEQLAAPGTACLTAGTLRLARGFVETRPAGPFEVRGLSAPVEVFELIAAAGRNRWDVRAAAHPLTPFVGRDMEMAVLSSALKRAEAGRGQIVAIVGEPGVGKSRLVHEFLKSVSRTDWTVLRTGATPHDRSTPFLLVAQLMRSWLGVHDRDGQVEISTKLVSAVAGIDEQLSAELAPLRSLLDLPNEDTAWERLDPPRRRQRIRDAVRLIMLRAAAVRPVILVVEDLHWIDSESQAVLDGIAEGLGAARLLLVAAYRPEYRHDWTSRSYYSLIRADPLEANAADELLRSLLGSGDELKSLRRRLIERTEGTPLFIEEIVRTLIETGALIVEPNNYRLTQSVEELEIPQSVQAVLAARVDRLPTDERTLLQIASVIGKTVALILLRGVANIPVERLHKQLSDLQAFEFLYEINLPSGIEYTFKHALTHDVTYEGMLLAHRRAWHAQVMRAIEKTYPDRLEEFTERLAYHALKGEAWRKAVDYCYKAGQRANLRWAHREAIAHFNRALEALAHLAKERWTIDRAIEIRLGLRVAFGAAGRFLQSRDCLEEAEELARSVDDRPRLALINIVKCTTLSILGVMDGAVEAGRIGCQIAEHLKDGSSIVNASYALGQAHWYQGDFQSAERVLSASRVLLTGNLRHQYSGTTGTGSVLCLGCLANTYSFMGAFEQAFACSQEACGIARETGRPYDLSYAHIAQGLAFLTRGDVDSAIQDLEAALRFCRAGEVQLLIPATARYLGRAYALAGRYDAARTLLEEALEQSKSYALVALVAWCGSVLAWAYLLSGMGRQAEEAGTVALELSRKHQYRPVEVLALRLLGAVYTEGGPNDSNRAETYCREAMALAGAIAMLPEVAHCHRDLAEILSRAGRPSEARMELSASLKLYRSMGMEGCAGQADAALATLVDRSGSGGRSRRMQP